MTTENWFSLIEADFNSFRNEIEASQLKNSRYWTFIATNIKQMMPNSYFLFNEFLIQSIVRYDEQEKVDRKYLALRNIDVKPEYRNHGIAGFVVKQMLYIKNVKLARLMFYNIVNERFFHQVIESHATIRDGNAYVNINDSRCFIYIEDEHKVQIEKFPLTEMLFSSFDFDNYIKDNRIVSICIDVLSD